MSGIGVLREGPLHAAVKDLLAKYDTLAFDPKWAYPSEAPGTPIVLNGANHGDGFVNSGVLDGSSATPFPDKLTVSFSAPGSCAAPQSGCTAAAHAWRSFY